MMNKTRIIRLTFFVILAIMGFVMGCHFTREVLPSDATSNCLTGSQALTVAEVNSWFESGTASLNGVVNAANSVTFPDIPNCSFYKWSHQMFLWLTSPSPSRYGGNGMIMNSPAFFDVSLPDESGNRKFLPHTSGLIRTFNLRTAQKGILDLPVIIEKGTLRMLEVIPTINGPRGNPLVLDANGTETEVGRIEMNPDKIPQLIDLEGRPIAKPRAILQSQSDTIAKPFITRLKKFEGFDRSSLVQKFIIDKHIFLDRKSVV